MWQFLCILLALAPKQLIGTTSNLLKIISHGCNFNMKTTFQLTVAYVLVLVLSLL